MQVTDANPSSTAASDPISSLTVNSKVHRVSFPGVNMQTPWLHGTEQ